MARLSIPLSIALLCGTGIATAWQQDNVTSRFSGIIINSGCTADEAFAESDKCFQVRGSEARLSLYDDTTRQIYDLNSQDQAKRYIGDSVTVEGTLQANTIQVAEIRKLTSIGLEVGQKAPMLSARDQYDEEQNLERLKGPQGTVLLFFRSADW